MKNSKAIVTLAVGEEYARRWKRWCQANWQMYADRHGYDLICFEQPLDDSERAKQRSPAWQKCLILSQPAIQQYKRVVWLDADILIHPAAPSIVEGVPLDKIGVVDLFASPAPELHPHIRASLQRMLVPLGMGNIVPTTAHLFYAAYGLSPSFTQVINTCLMVLTTAHHRQILERTYQSHEEESGPRKRLYEMPALSFEILQSGCAHWLDPKFNAQLLYFRALNYPFLLGSPGGNLSRESVNEALAQSYFLHFGSLRDELQLVNINAIPAYAPSKPMLTQPQQTTAARPSQLLTPVVLVLSDHSEATVRVFDKIREARPPKLFVIANKDNSALGRALVEQVDWDCQVLQNDSDVNLGTKPLIESGLKWVFEAVEAAIILEDNCLPHPTFFRFCEELLARYRDDERVMAISGDDFKFSQKRNGYSYCFSRYPLTWGWATWRRAWRLYDPLMQEWRRRLTMHWLEDYLQMPNAVMYWSAVFQKNSVTLESWEDAWTFSCWVHDGLCIHPNLNLVSNIHFRPDARHSKDPMRAFAGLPTEAVEFPLSHPPILARDRESDAFLEEAMFSGRLRRSLMLLRAQYPALRGRIPGK